MANIRAACFSSREVLPPRGFGAELPVSRQRCIHLTAVLAATSKTSAAARRDAPDVTVSITRCRKSSEYDLGIAPPLQRRINADTLAHP
jgi:hypothetical protein